MSELYFVRHAQASFGSRNYDQLSELGYQQAKWLGQWFRSQDVRPDQIITGTMVRQHQTADQLIQELGLDCQIREIAGFNEFDFHALTALYCRLTDQPVPTAEDGARRFFQLLRKAMLAWSRGELHAAGEGEFKPPLESWPQFHVRIANALNTLRELPDRQTVIVVSSGGAIAMALHQILQCSVDTLINLNLQAKNTGFSHLYFNQRSMLLSSFNNAPHLETADRRHALTYT